jgi:hypothetical protein
MPRLVPVARILTAADCRRKLGDEVFRDAVKAGVLKACCTKRTPAGERRFFTLTDVEAVEDLISGGKYPGQ